MTELSPSYVGAYIAIGLLYLAMWVAYLLQVIAEHRVRRLRRIYETNSRAARQRTDFERNLRKTPASHSVHTEDETTEVTDAEPATSSAPGVGAGGVFVTIKPSATQHPPSPASSSLPIPPTVGALASLIHHNGFLQANLQIARIVDPFAINDIYPDWVVRTITNLITYSVFLSSSFTVLEFIRLRYGVILMKPPDWIRMCVVGLNVSVASWLLTGVITKAVTRQVWAQNLSPFAGAVHVVLLCLLFDIQVVLLSRLILDVGNNAYAGADKETRDLPNEVRRPSSGSELGPSPSHKLSASGDLRGLTDSSSGEQEMSQSVQPLRPSKRDKPAAVFRRSSGMAVKQDFAAVVSRMRRLALFVTVPILAICVFVIYRSLDALLHRATEPITFVDPARFSTALAEEIPSLVAVYIVGAGALWYVWMPLRTLTRAYRLQ